MILMLLALADLIGRDYNAAVRHTPYDVERRAISQSARRVFHQTLDGPQVPAVQIERQGRELVVWETCTAHLCGDSHSVIARLGDRLFAMTITDQGRTIVVPDPGIERLIGSSCDGPQCDFDNPIVGRRVTPEALRLPDTQGIPDLRGCSYMSRGALVLRQDKRSVIRFRGRVRDLAPDGPERFVSVDDLVPIVVTISRGQLRILEDNEVVSFPIRKTCGADK